MNKRKKALVLILSAVLLVAVTIVGTLAYLTSTDTVKNTFTVGKVAIKLDEAQANTDGSLVAGADRVKANEYHLLPGHEYNKDPMVTVLTGSEASYVRMIVTISKSIELDDIFAPDGAKLLEIFTGYDSNNWILKNPTGTRDTDSNTISYEFRYKETVAAPSGDVALDALFDKIVVPGGLTNEQLAKIEDMTITVDAYAIQSDGFADADAAWIAFPVV